MKNPLADVLRQSNGSEHSLSDSGSYDANDVEFGATANDEQAVSDDAIDLQLLEATGALVLDNGTVQFEALTSPGIDIPVTVAATPPAVEDDVPERPPVLSRFAPAICLLAAVLAAGSFTVYRIVQSGYSSNTLGVAEFSAVHDANAVAGTVHLPGAEKFPFIDPDAVSGDAE